MDSPLHSTILDQIKRGVLEEIEYERPVSTADTEEWIEYLVAAHGVDAKELQSVTRPNLIKMVKELEA